MAKLKIQAQQVRDIATAVGADVLLTDEAWDRMSAATQATFIGDLLRVSFTPDTVTAQYVRDVPLPPSGVLSVYRLETGELVGLVRDFVVDENTVFNPYARDVRLKLSPPTTPAAAVSPISHSYPERFK